MPRLYIGNATRQTQRVYYRLDFTNEGEEIVGARNRAAVWQDIPAGRQDCLAKRDLPMEAIKDIIRQLNEYGMIGTVDAQKNDLPAKSVVPYVFNIDAVIPPSILQKVFDHNRGVQMHAGRTLREKAAIAGSQIIADATGEPQKVFELEIEQEGENESDTPAVAEGYRVLPDPDEGRRKPGRPRKTA